MLDFDALVHPVDAHGQDREVEVLGHDEAVLEDETGGAERRVVVHLPLLTLSKHIFDLVRVKTSYGLTRVGLIRLE